MSRAPPFPTRHTRSPSYGQSNAPTTVSLTSSGVSGTRPLQITRPASRPPTPTSASYTARGSPSNVVSSGPSRPQRSELRSRISEHSSTERTSTSSRDIGGDDTVVAPSSISQTYRPSINTSVFSDPRSDEGEKTTTPTSLSSAMSAFKSAGSRRRAMTNGSNDIEYQMERRNEIEAENIRQQRIQDKVPGRRTNGKARAGDIDAVLDQVKDGWEFVIDSDFNHVDLALQLLDDSSLGKDMDSFRRTKSMLSQALKGSVDKHYQAFAASLPHHASLINHLGAAQSQISDVRAALFEAKEALSSKRADLVQLWSRGQTLDEMMRILDQIEHLKSVPDLLETLMSEKRLLQASVLLVRSLKIVNKPEMIEIGAIADLRSYLNGQETALREVLIDEIHSHLYLKSFWCESRWSAYVPNQQALAFNDELEMKRSAHSQILPSSSLSRLSNFLDDLAIRPNDPPHDLNDPSLHSSDLGSPGTPSIPFASTTMPSISQPTINPEADSFAYMETLLESLAVLGKMGSALDNIAQRLPVEIYNLVESTLDEVEERAEYGRRGSMSALNGTLARAEGIYIFLDSSIVSAIAVKGGLMKASCLRLAALESSVKQVDHEILNDLFWTLYSKLDAVAQGLRVLYEVANRIGSRRYFKDSSGAKPGSLFPLTEIWVPVQAEVRTLIYDYLTDEEQGSVSGRNPISSINEILREGKFVRDRTKAVFRFTDTDGKQTAKALKPHEDELTRMLNEIMPGLVPGGSESTVQVTLLNAGSDDRMLGGTQHHRLLINPDAFHASVLFQPTLTFLSRVADVLPSGLESVQSASSILDEFVLKVYLPQLEEKVSFLFHQAVTGPEAFQSDPSSMRLSQEPLVKASTQLMALINSLCAMLRVTPFHQENYSRLILGVIIQFYQRCSDRFQDLVSVPNSGTSKLEPQLAIAAQWAQRAELGPCLSKLRRTPQSDKIEQERLCRHETHIEFDFLEGRTISLSELVPSIRNLAAMASLYRSVAWFSAELNALEVKSEEPMSPEGLEPQSAVSMNSAFQPLPRISSAEPLVLPLSREMTLRFQALLKTYEQLSSLILDSIRVDLRCRTMFYLDSALRHGNYSIDCEAGEPDPHIIDLNEELGQCDKFACINLPTLERQYIFMGLGHFMEHMLISNACHLRLPNTFGVKKILRNMLALQQSIKTLTNDQHNTEFGHAKLYYKLFFLTPQNMLKSIRENPVFSFEEYETMLKLQCGITIGEDDGKSENHDYNMYVIELHGLEMENAS